MTKRPNIEVTLTLTSGTPPTFYWVPSGVVIEKLSFTEFKELVFMLGVKDILLVICVPLDPKEKSCRAIWRDKREVVVIYIDELHINQALGWNTLLCSTCEYK